MNAEYYARLRYEENRNYKSPRIYFLRQIPTPLISKGKVEYRNFSSLQHRVTLHETIGTPRYCEWGADIQNCKVVYTYFCLDAVVLCTPRGIYRLYYYYESGTHDESQKVARDILWKRLFSLKN